MSWFKKIAQERILSKPEFEEMVQRVYNIHRDALEEYGFNSWEEWLNKETPYNIAITLDSEYEIYNRFLNNLPEDVMAIDLIKMYHKNQLPTAYNLQRDFSKIQIEETEENESNYPWGKIKAKDISPDEAANIYQTAIQRVTKTNKNEILDARKQLFFAFNSDKELSNKIGISTKELGKRIRQYSGLTNKEIQLEENLNQNIPEDFQWVGITNSSFIGTQSIDHEELESLVNYIKVNREFSDEYKKREGEALRSYIARTFLAIDTKIDYSDLGFEIDNIEEERTKGQYFPGDTKIVIDNLSPNTVAHEIGHYLDYKWARQYDDNLNPLSTSSRIIKDFPEIHQKWIVKYKN